MYLTDIDEKTGLVDIETIQDGVLAIKEFREVIEDKELGIHCFTAIALTADYKSPFRHYPDEDRPLAAMEAVTGNRRAFPWKIAMIQHALLKYQALQFNPTIEEGRIHQQRKINKLKELREAEENDGVERKDAAGNVLINRSPQKVSMELRNINDDIRKYEESIKGEDVFGGAPKRGSYYLTRLEQKALKRNSFYHDNR